LEKCQQPEKVIRKEGKKYRIIPELWFERVDFHLSGMITLNKSFDHAQDRVRD
jgi:hypothetical protein